MEMNLYPSIEAIDAALQQSNNVMGVSMEQLRDAHGPKDWATRSGLVSLISSGT